MTGAARRRHGAEAGLTNFRYLSLPVSAGVLTAAGGAWYNRIAL